LIVTIDNLDGLGAVDYSSALCPDKPLRIERTLNAPSVCSGMLNAGPASFTGSGTPLPAPVRRGRMVVTSDSGTVLFTGYLATEPVPIYAGVGLAGLVYRLSFSAVSDEWLLDKQTLTLTNAGFSVLAGTLLEGFAARVAPGLLSTAGVGISRLIGVFEPEPAKGWSANAANMAGSSYGAYRVLNGVLSFQLAGTVSHTLNFDAGLGDGTLQVSSLKTSQVKELANDVTLTGAMEPAAYVTEMFTGDGTTTVFTLSDPPFHAIVPTLLNDSFNLGVFNTQMWMVADPGSHLSFSGAGLTMNGGNGFDGQTTVAAIDQVEMGGSLVVEAASLQLNSGSDGVLCGLYQGVTERANCLAGYNVRQAGGNTVLTPFVNGVEVGTTYTILAGHTYTLRVRLHCVEMQRVLQTYYAAVDGVVETFGGGAVTAPMSLVFDLQDLGNSSNTPATVLYDGSVATSPASCTFVLVDSVELFGSVGSCSVTQTGSAWVVKQLVGGTLQTQLIGVAGQGVACRLTRAGTLTFLAGSIPAAGETVSVFYRMRSRSVARLEDAVSIALEEAGGMPGTARWLGKVLKPPARSSVDCESAVQAILSFASSRAAAIGGGYAAVNPTADIWPGDFLDITAAGQTINVVVRRVLIVDGNARPEVLSYSVDFANDWAEGLGLTLSEAIAVDALLPQVALTAAGQVLANLQQMAVTTATTAALQLNAGTDPPSGGGFEVRLLDGNFGPGTGADLVLRSPVRSFSIPRAAQIERYYVRMYDASTPPLYSRQSSAVFTNLPVG
jgi:hypothetical protein